MSKRVSIEKGSDPVIQSHVCPDSIKVYVDDLCVYDTANTQPIPICEQNADGKPCGSPARFAWTMCGEKHLLCASHASLLRSVGSFVEINAAITDSQRMDWLERNLLSISHDRATCSVDMSGRCVRGQLSNEARGANAGPSYFRVNHRSIREAVDAAMQWPNEPKLSGFEECASKSPKGSAAHRHSESGNDPSSATAEGEE